MVEKQLLTPEEAGQALSIGRTKVYELVRAGEIESIKIGVSRRVGYPFDRSTHTIWG
jgi:excisionase family DNA binding protein